MGVAHTLVSLVVYLWLHLSIGPWFTAPVLPWRCQAFHFSFHQAAGGHTWKGPWRSLFSPSVSFSSFSSSSWSVLLCVAWQAFASAHATAPSDRFFTSGGAFLYVLCSWHLLCGLLGIVCPDFLCTPRKWCWNLQSTFPCKECSRTPLRCLSRLRQTSCLFALGHLILFWLSGC